MAEGALLDRWWRAARLCRVEEMSQLLVEGVDVNAVDARGRSALFFAVTPFGGSLDAVELLIEHGAELDAGTPDGRPVDEWCNEGVSSALEARDARRIAQVLRRERARRGVNEV